MIPQPMCLAKSTRVAMLSRMFYAPWIPLPGAIELRQLVLNTFQISALLLWAHARAPAVILLRPTRVPTPGWMKLRTSSAPIRNRWNLPE
jgi:hypothetical protein